MKLTLTLLSLLLTLTLHAQIRPAKNTLFDAGWHFHHSGAQGGPSTIIGVGNANLRSLESCQRNAWQRRALVIVKSSEQVGKITLRASTEGLPAAEVAIEAE